MALINQLKETNSSVQLGSQFFKKRAFFKPTITTTKTITIPKAELDVLGIEEGEDVDVFLTWPGKEEPIIATKTTNKRPSGVTLVRLSDELPLEFPEIGAAVVTKAGNDVNLKSEIYDLSTDFLFNTLMQKSKLSEAGGTNVITIKSNEAKWFDLIKGDKLNASLIDLESNNFRNLSRMPKYRVKVRGQERHLRFTVKAPLVRQRSFKTGNMIQTVARPTFI